MVFCKIVYVQRGSTGRSWQGRHAHQRGTGGRELQGQGAARTQPMPLPRGGPRMRSSHGVTWAQRKVAGPDPSWHPLGWPVIAGAEGSRRERLRQRTTAGRPHGPLGSLRCPLHRHVGTHHGEHRGSASCRALELFQEPCALLLLPAAHRRTRFLRGTGKSSRCPPFTPSHRESGLYLGEADDAESDRE